MIRAYLRELRLKNELTQKRTAAATGLTRQYYQMIEAGKRLRRMDATLMLRLAALFKVQAGYILENELAREQHCPGHKQSVSHVLSDILDNGGKQ